MEFKKYSKTLFFGATLAVLAGCGGNAATMDQDSSGGDVQPVLTNDGASSSGAAVDSAVSSEQLAAERAAQEARDAAAAMPEVNTIYFDFDTSDIRPDSREILDMHAEYLMANPSVSIVLEGNADERGTPEYNIALGERRALAVSRYLINSGVSESQVTVVSYGEEKPAVKSRTEAAHAKNRRAVLVY